MTDTSVVYTLDRVSELELRVRNLEATVAELLRYAEHDLDPGAAYSDTDPTRRLLRVRELVAAYNARRPT